MKPELKLLLSEAIQEGCLELADIERETILITLLVCANNKDKAARMLGVAPCTIRRKIDEYGWEAIKGQWPVTNVGVQAEERSHAAH